METVMTNPVVEQSMSVKPETILVIVGVCFFIFVFISLIIWLWTKFK